MKLKYYQFLFALIFLIFPISHWGQNQSYSIVGKWVLDYNLTSGEMDTNGEKVFNGLPKAHLSAIENAYKGRQMFFLENNVFELKLLDGRSSIGGWELNVSEKVLKIKNEKTNREYLYKIYELTNEKLVIEELGAKGRGYFKKLHFTKSKS